MNIVHISQRYYPVIGGMESVVKNLAEEQAKLGNQLTVVCSEIGAQKRPCREIINGVNIIRVKSIKLLNNDNFEIPLQQPELQSANIIHVHSQNSLFSLILSKKLKEKLNSKLVFCFMAVNSWRGDGLGIIAKFLGPLFQQYTINKAIELSDLCIVKSYRDRETLCEKFHVNADYLPDAVPQFSLDYKKKDSGHFRERFNIKQKNIILFIGRLQFLKGPHILVSSLNCLKKDDNVAAVFVGSDQGSRRSLGELAEKLGVLDHVYFLGYVDEETKIDAIDSSIAVVVPSLYDYVEVFSISISEAWARSKPVIASAIGEIPYRVKNGTSGILVRPSDPIELAKAISYIANNPNMAAEMGINGKRSVLSWKDVAKRSLDLYTQSS